MPAGIRRRAQVQAPPEAWQLLGRRLEARRRWLGHTWRTTFAAERGINTRLAADVETAARKRIGHFMPSTLQLIAQGYAVTEESVYAVLAGEAQDLTPVPPAPVPADAAPGGRGGPMGGDARIAAARPYADWIWDRLLAGRIPRELPARLGRIWADLEDMDVPDRVWLIADLWRRADDRDRPRLRAM